MRRAWRAGVDRARAGVDRVRENPFPLALGALGLLAAALVGTIAVHLFPYLSTNHDEGVYLQQAAMLLEGSLRISPPVPDAVRPWFFVADGETLYPKYSPVVPALFAPGLAAGVPRLALVAVAAGNAILVGLLGREAFDRRTGAVAAALLLTAPLFLLASSTFLSYAPTTFLNLLFALGYVRAHRGSRRGDRHRRRTLGYAALAGVTIGLAFFARPFTAVLFALPFVGHALASLVRSRRDPRELRKTVERLGVVAALGTAFVALSLSYNWLLTGDPLVFPYQAFAPEDGIGLGRRRLLEYERHYTASLALEANSRVLRQLLTRWGPLGWLGTVLAAVGLVAGLGLPLRRRLTDGSSGAERAANGIDRLTLRALLASLSGTVVAGNVFFWGNLNLLANLEDPTDGLIASVGPVYHFDLLLPLSVFAAAGLLVVADLTRSLIDRIDGDVARRVATAIALVVGLLVAGGVQADALAEPVERNAAYTDDLAAAYEPFEETDRDHAVVFVPTPQGAWLQHPFQWLRNDPSLDGDVLYVLDRDAAGDFESVDAFADRRPYRFTYRGTWRPGEDGLDAVLRPLEVREGDRLRVDTRVGVVAGAQSATVRLAADGESVMYGVERLSSDEEVVTWVVGPGEARVVGDGLHRYSENASVPVDGAAVVALSVTFTQPGGSTVTYRQELDVEPDGDRIRAIAPPESRVCTLTPDCGREGTFVAGGDYPTGASLTTNVTGGATDD